jgi:hypothetical protein
MIYIAFGVNMSLKLCNSLEGNFSASIYLSDIILIGAIIIVLFINNVLAVEKFDLSSFILLNGQ